MIFILTHLDDTAHFASDLVTEDFETLTPREIEFLKMVAADPSARQKMTGKTARVLLEIPVIKAHMAEKEITRADDALRQQYDIMMDVLREEIQPEYADYYHDARNRYFEPVAELPL